MFQDFEISVTPFKNKNNEYLVRTENIAPGVPVSEEQVYWPIQDWFTQVRQIMQDPLLQIFESNGIHATDILDLEYLLSPQNNSSAPNLESVGQQLFNSLFQGSLKTSWMIAQGIAHNHRAAIRLRLFIKDTYTNRLPWEILHDGERPLATGMTGIDVAFSRYLIYPGKSKRNNQVNAISARETSIKILMIIAGPDDLESLALLEEVKHLETELENSALKLEVLKQPGREKLTQTLEQGKYKIFHYAGHSNLGDAGGDLYLVNHKTGLTETMPGDDLVGLLRNNGIQLAVFNSCRSTDTVLEDPSLSSPNSLTQALIKHEIPAVLAMAEQIPDEVALTLSRLFYRNLNLGYPIDLSLSRARQGLISTYGSKQFYWALPVLYLHPDFDGILLRKQKQNQSFPQEFLSLEEEDFLPFPGDEEEENSEKFVRAYLSEEKLDSTFPEAEDGAEAFIREVFADFADQETTLFLEPSPEAVAVEDDRDYLGKEPAENYQVESPEEDWQRRWQILPKKPLLVTAITIAIAFMTILLSNIEQTPRISQVQITEEFRETGISPNVETETLFNIILAEIRTGNLERALGGIEVLLERGAIPYAENALNAIPIDTTNNAEVMFLKGRSAWEYYLQGHQNYPEPDDARRFWELAVKSEPHLDYLTALGFAYYEEGQYSRAIDTWYDGIRIASREQTENSQTRTIYAGLALGLSKLAEETQGRQGEITREQGVGIYNTVMKQDPLQFRPESLSQEWLWSEKAIIDWEKF